MSVLDWIVLVSSIVGIVWFGLRRSRGAQDCDSYMLAGHSMPWYVMGFSIMATQASAITFISTTGQAYVDGMRFVQFYFGLPIAMFVIASAFVPRYLSSGVFTAYEYLERRFDGKTRALVTLIFLVQRGMAVGIAIHAQAIALAVMLGLPDRVTGAAVGVVVVAYTTIGGVKAVEWTQFVQMIVMTVGLVAALFAVVMMLPEDVGLSGALTIAGAAGRLNPIVLDFDWNDRYNVWSGLIGGCFLALAYFGCDQTQVQRYLTGRSEADSRGSLMFNAAAKIPFQFFVLFIGAIVFVFYMFVQPPLVFEPDGMGSLRGSAEFSELHTRYDQAFEARKQAAMGLVEGGSEEEFRAALLGFERVRQEAFGKVAEANGESSFNDTNYVFLSFVTSQLPAGLVGLVMAAILGAAMSSIASQFNSLATVTLVDLYRRYGVKGALDSHYLKVVKVLTVLWGAFAVLTAELAGGYGALIETINMLGSLFYGGMLGIFLLAFFFPRVKANAAFASVLIGQAAVFWTASQTGVSFLWYNVIGCGVVIVSAVILSGRGEPA